MSGSGLLGGTGPVEVAVIDSPRKPAGKTERYRAGESTAAKQVWARATANFPGHEKSELPFKKGDLIRVKVLEVDRQGRVRLSMRDVGPPS